MTSEVAVLLHLMQVRGIGLRSLTRLLNALQRDQLTLLDFADLSLEELVERFGLTEEQASAFLGGTEPAEQLAEFLTVNAIRILPRHDSRYPSRLISVLEDRAPPVLFLAGSPHLLSQRGIGFCGARNASEEGLRCAEAIAGTLANEGLLVISGHAPGIDEATHRAALQRGATTALVLPEGILQFRARPSLAEFMSEDQAVVISEFPPKLPWSVSNAMQRNRTICGLAEVLVVIEAGKSGGTWEAGMEALKLKVPLFVLEFAEAPKSAEGNQALIRKGGIPIPCRTGEAPDLSRLHELLKSRQNSPVDGLLF